MIQMVNCFPWSIILLFSILKTTVTNCKQSYIKLPNLYQKKNCVNTLLHRYVDVITSTKNTHTTKKKSFDWF